MKQGRDIMRSLIAALVLLTSGSAPAENWSLRPRTAFCLTDDALEELRLTAREQGEEQGSWLCGETGADWIDRVVVLESGPRNSRVHVSADGASTVAWVPTATLVKEGAAAGL
jgi:hypothetical protein